MRNVEVNYPPHTFVTDSGTSVAIFQMVSVVLHYNKLLSYNSRMDPEEVFIDLGLGSETT